MEIESTALSPPSTVQQLLRYGLIGVFTNLAGYGLYLLLTYAGLQPKVTMTALYSLGALIGFFSNRRFTFRHDGHIGRAGIRFMLVHLMGYTLNFLILVFFVDWLGFAHQLVQAAAIVVVAAFLFVLFRLFVFATPPAKEGLTEP